jgi:serine/threonine-protein kinase
MTPERWQKIIDLADAASELPGEDRAAFLNKACDGDHSMRSEVESLLASDQQTQSRFEGFGIAAELIADEQPESMIGLDVGPFKIVDSLGVGGMGEVYLGLDTHLDRKVALKFLPAFFTNDKASVRRFEQEARAASALNHPNIITVYKIGRSRGRHFIATEFVEGETLGHRFKSRRMSVSEVLDVAIQAASALEAAHQTGVVHRDIKPDNIMVRPDGLVKVLDFGLAKISVQRREMLESGGPLESGSNTQSGAVLGTPHYMSPEQARGLKVDGRTDIFSLGVVIYEMLTGRKPFEGETPSHVVVAILEKDPQPMSELSTGCPPGLEQIVSRALQKDTGTRYQSATDLMADLKTLQQKMGSEPDRAQVYVDDTRARSTGGGTSLEGSARKRPGSLRLQRTEWKTPGRAYLISQIRRYKRSLVFGLGAIILAAAGAVHFWSSSGDGKTIKSLAVLPFVNASSDPGLAYLSDGIADSLTGSLSRISNLTVISSTAVSRYEARDRQAGGPDVKAVGREFSVQAVVAGKVALQGDRIYINAELIDTQNNSRLWGEQYDRKFTDVIGAQEDIVKRISEKLRSRLAGSQQSLQVGKHYGDNAEAYQAYLKGRYFSNKRTDEGIRKAIEFYDQAIGLDPNYALGYAGLADSYMLLSGYSGLSPTVCCPKAKAAAEEAIKLDDSLAEAHSSLALVKFMYEWDWGGAEREFKRAIELDPNYATAHKWYGRYLGDMGRKEESLAEGTRAVALDPLSRAVILEPGCAYMVARQYDRALEEFRNAAKTFPDFPVAHQFLSWACAAKGMYDEALRECETAIALDDNVTLLVQLAYVYALTGKRTEAQKLLAELTRDSKKRFASPSDIAVVYGALGDRQRAFDWLEKAYEERDWGLVDLNVYPEFDSLRSDARFSDLLKRMNLG